MAKEIPKPIYLKDYIPPAFLIETVDLHFDLHEEFTTVTSHLKLRRNRDVAAAHGNTVPLVLNGERLLLKSIALNGKALNAQEYKVDEKQLILSQVPDELTLDIITQIKPQENTTLEGLYKSNGNYCTQNEAHGFRKITYYLDRPDVMARFTTTIAADKTRYPVLLSNGNLVAKGEVDKMRHWVKWEDPFKKPCYLFALVAGDLVHIEDSFMTRSKQKITLRIFVEKGNQDKCAHAMQSVKKAMRWDEETYGREYDLDIFMIVAVSDFNMGAMENKGLNIFNTVYILANSETATDSDYAGIERVIGHEYFHNWTGDRITCCNWFQLSLKEGLTVFRDQEFGADVQSRSVVRIDNVRSLRARQFLEDAGPLAHPVRPESYIEMNNFYTATVYNKGAEVIRMMQTLLGKNNFRKGMDLYFTRHDGQAVTCEDFVKSMEDANQVDFKQFRLWYNQAGTPTLAIQRRYDAKAKTYTLIIKQHCPPTPGQPTKQPMHIPLMMGLLDRHGNEIPLRLQGEPQSSGQTTCVLEVKKPVEEFCFINIPEEPIPSLLRDFSAPVKCQSDYSFEELLFLLARDTNEFNRWEASQQLAIKVILELMTHYQQERPLKLDAGFVKAFREMLNDKALDPALKAQILALPTESTLGELLPVIDADAIYHARHFVIVELAQQLKVDFIQQYQANAGKGPYVFEQLAVAQRSLKNACLSYLSLLNDPKHRELCLQQFDRADNMTDKLGALRALSHIDVPERVIALNKFYQTWKHDALVVDKWFTTQATSELPDTIQHVKQLLSHPAFNIKNPNKVRALIGAFSGNFICFHASNGEGYKFLADHVLTLNKLNPLMAARLLEPLTRWRRFEPKCQALMKAQLERISQASDLSNDVYEIVSKSLVNGVIPAKAGI